MRDALVRIDEETLGMCFTADAEKVVARDSAYLKDFPYLEFVNPLRNEFETMENEISDLASDFYGKGAYNRDKDRRMEKKAFVKGNYGSKFLNLLSRLNETRKRVSGLPQTAESLDRLEMEIRQARTRHTDGK